jgi:hypothetical protein
MSLPCYKLNNSYTVYINYHYLNDCIKAGKIHEKKKLQLVEIQKRVQKALQPKVTPPKKVVPLIPSTLVWHKIYGRGKVLSTNKSNVLRVAFGKDIRRFIYPSAIQQGYLSVLSK